MELEMEESEEEWLRRRIKELELYLCFVFLNGQLLPWLLWSLNQSANCRSTAGSFGSGHQGTVGIHLLSAHEVKNNCSLYERLFKLKKSGVFLFGISFFVLEIFAFLYYANEESDDVIDRSTEMIKYWIKNIYRNIGAVIFKLGTRTVHHKRNKMTPAILLPWQHPWFQSLSV